MVTGIAVSATELSSQVLLNPRISGHGALFRKSYTSSHFGEERLRVQMSMGGVFRTEDEESWKSRCVMD